MKYKIELTTDKKILDRCALLMSQTEPWMILNRDLQGCEEALQGDHKEVYVSIEAEKLLGFIVLQMTGTFKGYIQSICVLSEMRSAGLGTALIRFAEERIFLISPNVFMMVSSFNEKAAKLYFKLGYEKIGTLKNFVVDGLDEFLLRKTLGSLNGFNTSRNRKS